MARLQEAVKGEGAGEKGLRFLRNINAVTALAFYGAGVVAPVVAAPMNVLAGFNAAQAGGWELARRYAKNRRQRPVPAN